MKLNMIEPIHLLYLNTDDQVKAIEDYLIEPIHLLYLNEMILHIILI